MQGTGQSWVKNFTLSTAFGVNVRAALWKGIPVRSDLIFSQSQQELHRAAAPCWQQAPLDPPDCGSPNSSSGWRHLALQPLSRDYPFNCSPPWDGEMRLQLVTASITDSRNITFVMLKLPMSRYVQHCKHSWSVTKPLPMKTASGSRNSFQRRLLRCLSQSS